MAKKTYFFEQDKKRDSLYSLAYLLREGGIPAFTLQSRLLVTGRRDTRFRLFRDEIYCLEIVVLSQFPRVSVGKSKVYFKSFTSEFRRRIRLNTAVK